MKKSGRPKNNLSIDNLQSYLDKIEEGPENFSVNELADLLGFSYRTMFRKVKGFEIMGFQCGKNGSQWRIPKNAIIEFINENCCLNKGPGF